MNCCCGCEASPFENTLHYSSPAHGGWGVVRMGHLLPESYQLFISPAACGRHGAIGACMQGRKSRVSYLYLREEDIVSGAYEDLFVQAVDELLDHLAHIGRLPKVLMVFVSCIDDLLGTDHDALLDIFESRHPDVRFTFCHMNPISLDTKVPPPVNIQNKIYSMLDVAQQKDTGVNLIGNLVAIQKNCEVFDILREMGVETVRHLTDYQTFADFQAMAKSQRNVVIAPPGQYAAEQMLKKHGTPYTMALPAYTPEEVTQNYQRIADDLGTVCPPVRSYEEMCRAAFEETREFLAGRPIVLDGDAVVGPFRLAKALLEHGFCVKQVWEQQVTACDREAYAWVREHFPQLSILQPQHHNALLFQNPMPDCLAIGYNSGYLTGSKHVVAADGQQGLFGYQGMVDLLDMMRQAVSGISDLEALIQAAGLVV